MFLLKKHVLEPNHSSAKQEKPWSRGAKKRNMKTNLQVSLCSCKERSDREDLIPTVRSLVSAVDALFVYCSKVLLF